MNDTVKKRYPKIAQFEIWGAPKSATNFSFFISIKLLPQLSYYILTDSLFKLLCRASKGFLKAFKAFIKPFEAPQRSVKIKI